jgi:predicted  nucleic acid-binding Zn ribbon protein
MHSISIKYNQKVDENELWHTFYSVVGNLRESGQINGREQNASIKDNRISCSLWTFTEEALDEKFHTHHVKTAIEKLENLCGHKLNIQYDGRGEEEAESICTCTEHAYYVLYYYGDFSPIRCGSCEKWVPLFKIPKLHDDRIWDIRGWVSTYQACVRLDLNCGTGEKWAIKQMSEFDSGLSKQGRKVAAKLTEVSGVKTYYFLTNVAKRKRDIDINRPCPSCGGEWHLEEEKFGYFRHQCDKCLLMSAYSPYQLK